MTVSLCVIAYNEESTLPKLLDDIKKQDYPHEKIELVFVDNMSQDKTVDVIESFAKSDNSFKSICICTCKKHMQAACWNVAIENSNEDIIIRVDAHASIPNNFVSTNVKTIESGEYVCGGGRPSRTQSNTPWQKTLLAAEECLFGTSPVYRKKQTKKQYVNSVFHGAYRREVFAKAGGFNESLGRTEDNEMHYRIRQSGYNICLTPDVTSYQNVRSSLLKMIKQKYGNGYWIGLTSAVCPGCLSCFYFAPFLLVCAFIFFGVFALFGIGLPLLLFSLAYILFDVLITVSAFLGRKRYISFLLLPFIFPLLHISYGFGTLLGLIKAPFWKRRIDKSVYERIQEVGKTVQNRIKEA